MNSSVDLSPLRLAPGPQLLLDDTIVEDRFQLTRVLYQPVKHHHNPILVRDQPWEGDGILSPQVVWDKQESQYRMWYSCFSNSAYYGGGITYYVAHATSDDGHRWQKPRRDAIAIGEHTETNVVYTGAHCDPNTNRRMVACGQVFIDEHEPDPARRYKMIALDGRPDPKHNNAVNTEPNLVCSADGLNWQLQGDRSILDHHSDTKNHVVYDAARQHWLLYCRPAVYASGRDMLHDHRHHRRRMAVMISKDFINWSYPRTVLYGDERDLPDIDHATVFRYGSHFLMFYAAMDGVETGRMYTRLASSGDGIHWHRFQSREDFIAMGSEGHWDAGRLGTLCKPVQSGEQLLLYYGGAQFGQFETLQAHGSSPWHIGLAEMKVDRFVAQRASKQTGYLLTREFILEGDTLTVNLVADNRPDAKPSLRVEVLRHPPIGEHADFYFRENGYTYAFPGFGLDDCVPISGDHTCLQVRWQEKSLAELRGQTVYLRFELRSVDLFSFQISEDES